MTQTISGSTNLFLSKSPKLFRLLGASLLIASGAIAEPTTLKINADVWADNWFALYIDGSLVKEDSVSIQTERSFNAESFQFTTQVPTVLSFVIKDFKQNDTGLEYIGTRRQQMGDGGFIAQFTNAETGSPLLVSNNDWRCLPIHIAPLNKSCEKSADPSADCRFSNLAEPEQWQSINFDDATWPHAIEYSEQSVRPKDGYDRVQWQTDAKLIWTSDLETDNTLLCRVLLNPTGE